MAEEGTEMTVDAFLLRRFPEHEALAGVEEGDVTWLTRR